MHEFRIVLNDRESPTSCKDLALIRSRYLGWAVVKLRWALRSALKEFIHSNWSNQKPNGNILPWFNNVKNNLNVYYSYED